MKINKVSAAKTSMIDELSPEQLLEIKTPDEYAKTTTEDVPLNLLYFVV